MSAPEILGFNALNNDDILFLDDVYLNFENDLRDALQFYNPDTPYLPQSLRSRIDGILGDIEINREHKETTDYIIKALNQNKTENLCEFILRAAHFRKFLG